MLKNTSIAPKTNITRISYNLQGMASCKHRLWARTFFEGLQTILDVVNLQENKLRRERIHCFPCKVLWNAHFVTTAMIDGIRWGWNDLVDVKKEGFISLAIHGRLGNNIIDEGIFPSQRAIWGKQDHLRLGKIGILKIYAPTKSLECTMLWRDLFLILDFACKWIVLGDFNMIEKSCEQRGGNRIAIHGQIL